MKSMHAAPGMEWAYRHKSKINETTREGGVAHTGCPVIGVAVGKVNTTTSTVLVIG